MIVRRQSCGFTLFSQVVRQLLFADQGIHGSELERLLVSQRGLVHKLTCLVDVDIASDRDRMQTFTIGGIDQPIGHLPHFPRHALAQEHFRGRLVGCNSNEVALQADSLERFSQIRVNPTHPERLNPADRLQQDFVGGAGDQVVGRGVVGAPGYDSLPGLFELQKQVSQGFDRGWRHRQRADMQHNPFDARVGRNGPQLNCQLLQAGGCRPQPAHQQITPRLAVFGVGAFQRERHVVWRLAQPAEQISNRPNWIGDE